MSIVDYYKVGKWGSAEDSAGAVPSVVLSTAVENVVRYPST